MAIGTNPIAHPQYASEEKVYIFYTMKVFQGVKTFIYGLDIFLTAPKI